MPRFDVTAARREIDAGREPVELVFNEKIYKFPGALPAAVEIEQMAVQRELRGVPDSQLATEQSDRMMRACFGEHYDELVSSVGTMELVTGMSWLMKYWSEPYQDPTIIQGLMDRHGGKLPVTAKSPNGPTASSSSASSTSTPSSRPTSKGSTGSTSPGPSSDNGSPGVDSSPFMEASAARQ